MGQCAMCKAPAAEAVLAEAQNYAFWRNAAGACPACLQQTLLRTLLERGDAALHAAAQTAWPLDAEAAFGALPTPLRLHADPRFAGRGITLALADAGFYPHPDLIQPRNRIRAWVDATCEPLDVRTFGKNEMPTWPGWDALPDTPEKNQQWHGTMTSVVAAGNGYLSRGLYRGLASEADLVLLRTMDAQGHISDDAVLRALQWLVENAAPFGVRVASLSISGDEPASLRDNPVDAAVAKLFAAGVSVVAAAGNSGERRLIPPASAPYALTVGGIDDKNNFSDEEIELWHSNYGTAGNDAPKPEIVAPSLWVAAPVLPGSGVAREAAELFARRKRDDRARMEIDARLAELKLITPHYQHAEGTSFAAPMAASVICCMLEANPSLTPQLVRDILQGTAHAVPGAPQERQGAGAIEAGRAVARALAERHGDAAQLASPQISAAGVTFACHDHNAMKVEIFGSWNGWRQPVPAKQFEAGAWRTAPVQIAAGEHSYKFLIDGWRWLDDPANPCKSPDGAGGLNSVLAPGNS